MSQTFLADRRGNFLIDGLLFVALAFAFALVVMYVYEPLTEVKDVVVNDPDIAIEGKTQLIDLHSKYSSTADSGFIALFISIWLMSLISAFFIGSHPIFFPIMAFGFIAVIFVGAVLGNAYVDATDDASLDVIKSQLPSVVFIMSKPVEILIVYALTVGIAMFVRFKLTGGSPI